jgi:hypothetical protein
MAIFPSLEPAGRTFVQGEIPYGTTTAISGAQIRWRDASLPVGQRLALQYEHLTRAELDLLLAHYRTQNGSNFPFALSAVVLSGFTDTVVPASLTWRYAGQPQVQTRGTLHNVSIELVAAS